MSEKMGNNRLELANREDRQVDAFHDINEMVIRFNKNHPCDDETLAAKAYNLARVVYVSFAPYVKKGRTLAEVLDLIKEKYEPYCRRIELEGRQKPSLDRFERICSILHDVIMESATEGNGACCFAEYYPLGLSFLADGISDGRVSPYVPRIQQKRMIAAIKKISDARDRLSDSLSFALTDEFKKSYDQQEENCSDDLFYKFLFQGDRDHAIFNPAQIKLRVEECKFQLKWLDEFRTVASRCYSEDFFGLDFLSNLVLYQFSKSRLLFSNPVQWKNDLEREADKDYLEKVRADGRLKGFWDELQAGIKEGQDILKIESINASGAKMAVEQKLNFLLQQKQRILDLLEREGLSFEDVGIESNKDSECGIGEAVENEGECPQKGRRKCVLQEGGKVGKRKGRGENYFSHRKGRDLIDGRVVVSEKGDMLTIKNKGQEYEIKAKSQDFWETVDGLIDWYTDEMKGCKGKSDKLSRARELSDEKGRIVPDGKRIRNAIGTLFRRDFGPDVKKEILFRFTTEGCKGTPECYVNFARDLFLSRR